MTNLQTLHESLTRWEVPDSWAKREYDGGEV